MRVTHSIRYAAPDTWHTLLRRRALQPPPEPDRGALLTAFRAHSRFYRERLADCSGWDTVPPLPRAEVAGVPVRPAGIMYDTRTSGTSGRQVLIQNSQAECRFRQSLAYRPFLFCELGTEVRQLIFVDGAEVDALDKPQHPFPYGGRRYLTWRAGIAADPGRILTLLCALRPQLLRGLCSGLVRFVAGVNGEELKDLGVRLVSPSGEQLQRSWRLQLERAFGAPVLDRYGATETGALAWQCPQCGAYHANADEVILEAGAAGVLATPLFIETQPLLRYQLEDDVTLLQAHPDCPVRLPTLQINAARRDDWLLDAGGAQVAPLSFQFERIPGLKAWRIYQDVAGVLNVYFDADAGSVTAVDAALRSQVQARVPGRTVRMHRGVQALPVRGKYKRIVSDLATPS